MGNPGIYTRSASASPRPEPDYSRHLPDTALNPNWERKTPILYIDKCPPYPGQQSEELGDDVVARLNPATREVENLEVMFFSTRLLRSDVIGLPVTADLRLTAP